MRKVVEVSDLTKIYRVFHGPRALFKELVLGRANHTPIRALSNVTFEVSSGETFGVVGDNGAGKSTLLKILTGTASPSSGSVRVDGRVGALLELGAGFHPEFSGRDNIYFTGSAMGLSREVIRENKRDIIEFSELGSFIDEPVKTYSSGMYVRLGFAVATGFEFSVLIIDEALAVGDQRFQKKCTDRITGFRKAGKTILFCSHNLYQVRTLCNRAIWLDRGETMEVGPAAHVVEAYTAFNRDQEQAQTARSTPEATRGQSQVCWIGRVQLQNEAGQPCSSFSSGESFGLLIESHFTSAFQGTPAVGLSLLRNDGVVLYTTSSSMDGEELTDLGEGRFAIRVWFENCPLLSGAYCFNVYATDQDYVQAYDIAEKVAPFTIRDAGPDLGLVRLSHRWH